MQRRLIVPGAHDLLTRQSSRRAIGRRLHNGHVEAQRRCRREQHAPELPATQDAQVCFSHQPSAVSEKLMATPQGMTVYTTHSRIGPTQRIPPATEAES